MIEESALIRQIRTVTATQPDFVYNNTPDTALAGIAYRRLSYRPNENNRCGCGVGEALIELGVPAEVLQELDRCPQPTGWAAPAAQRALQDWVTREGLVSAWVQAFQEYQDMGLSWSEATGRADTLAQKCGWAWM